MSYPEKNASFNFIISVLLSALLVACNNVEAKSVPGIGLADIATHIAGIQHDTLVVATGSTYRFTVDTPEDSGLVSTGIDAEGLLQQIQSSDGSAQKYQILDINGELKTRSNIVTGDRLVVTSEDNSDSQTYRIIVKRMALNGRLRLQPDKITIGTKRDITLFFTAGQRSPDVTVQISIPRGIQVTMENTTVNVIGRGDVCLKDLSAQSIGRTGTNYSYSKVGEAVLTESKDGSSILTFSHLDFRPANGADLKIVIHNVNLFKTGNYMFKARYTTSKPEMLTSSGIGPEVAILSGVNTITDFQRTLDDGLTYEEKPDTYTKTGFTWTSDESGSYIELMQSLDEGKTWISRPESVDPENTILSVSGLEPDRFHTFRLRIKNGKHKGFSNPVYFYSGKLDIKTFGVSGDSAIDATDQINQAIAYIHKIGGGTLFFSEGIYCVRTVHMMSNVYLYLDSGATIKSLRNADAPESTWFSDRQYRSGLSPTDPGPYTNPENWLTKQDVGHTFFRNTMFFGERLDNIKIIGTGRITGNGNLVTTDRVMNFAPDNRADKMFTFKLCTNIEIGGLYRDEDLWYDPDQDEPYYIDKDGSKNFDTGNMLNIDRGGHFVLLATGCDDVHMHDTYFAKYNPHDARDIYDFMACNDVTVTNIYSKVSSDDIVKLGSDCSLGFTRPVSNYKVRNIIGDTNCNLFQIGSETADDIMHVCVDNIYVLGANKAGFSISTNDGAHVKDIHLNCGHTGPIHSRSKMYRTRAPFFISISNRGRVLGANVGKFAFTENGKSHDELLCTNSSIGEVENIILNGIDICEVYSGSSFRHPDIRWTPYDGSQSKATPIVAGYKLPESEVVEGGLTFTLPNGKHTGYIKNIRFTDVNVLVKGGNPLSDRDACPPELGVGQYNVGNLGVQPSFGLWARHVEGLIVQDCGFNYEKRDSRYAVFLDDVKGARISNVKMVRAKGSDAVIGQKDASDVTVENTIYYDDMWGKNPKVFSKEDLRSKK